MRPPMISSARSLRLRHRPYLGLAYNYNNENQTLRSPSFLCTGLSSVRNDTKIKNFPSPDMSTESPFDLSTKLNRKAERLIWVDLEMTGLDVVKDKILEIACLVTEGDLSLVAEGPNLVIHHNDSVLNQMGEWCVQHHGQSGLTEAVRKSKISTEEAESMVLEFLQKYTPKARCPVAGNSVGMDKRFLDEHMPKLSQHFHYRVVDVSTVKELCRRWYPSNFKNTPPKKLSHRAMDDIKESIEELKFYRSSIFK